MSPGTPSAGSETATAPLLLVSVGSDHHPFDRLIRWVDDYLDSRVPGELRCVVQHGPGSPPRSGEPHPFLGYDELQELMRQATAIVVHGGPSSMLESLRNGRIPIAVPRQRRHGEAVDDHQAAFCELLAERGEVVLVNTAAELSDALDRALATPASFAAPATRYAADRAQAVERFAALARECQPARRARLLRRRQLND